MYIIYIPFYEDLTLLDITRGKLDELFLGKWK